MEEDSYLKQKLRSSVCFSCCFGARDRREEEIEVEQSDEQPRFIRASSSWLRSRAQELPELKDKCRNLISRIGKSRRQSSDCRYDPLSYALNFDEGSDELLEDEFRFRNFSARLPASPPPPTSAVKISHEITSRRSCQLALPLNVRRLILDDEDEVDAYEAAEACDSYRRYHGVSSLARACASNACVRNVPGIEPWVPLD